MNINDLEQSWEIVQDLSDDADVSSFDLISDDMDSGLGNFEDTSDLPLPAPVLPISGPRFSSPFQLDSTAPVFSKVHHSCTYEPGLPRPELVQRLEPTRIHGLQSGGLPVPKIRMKRPDSIVSVLETPAASSQLTHFRNIEISVDRLLWPNVNECSCRPLSLSRPMFLESRWQVTANWFSLCGSRFRMFLVTNRSFFRICDIAHNRRNM